MKTLYFLLFTVFTLSITMAQNVVINEFDCDTQGIDTKEFVELRSEFPNTALDGFVLVFFNGSSSGDDRSYFTLDLAGSSTDVNGLLLIGSYNVSPIPDLYVPANFMQNGTDAVAIYTGTAADFPDQTQATTTNLVDALIYQTGSGDGNDTGLQTLLGVNFQVDEDENGNKDFDSIARDEFDPSPNPITYTVGTPTPGMLNDGSGFDFNGIDINTDQNVYDEGEIMTITFTTEFAVTENITINFTLHNSGFNSSDYTGTDNFTILTGQSSASVQIQLLDDGINDGDEFAEIDLGAIPEGFNRLVDNIEVQINDVNFAVANYGTPLNPTYSQVIPTTPANYYSTLNGLSGVNLQNAMQNIIADRSVVRTQTYADIIDILKEADVNPLNSNEVWLLYTEQSRKKILFQSQGGSSTGLWNREHTYPRSRGGFDELEDVDEIADGINVFIETEADSLRHAYSDGHGLRAADGPENSSRGNKDYGQYSGPSGSQDSWKGDVARAVMFLAVRYNDLELVTGNPADTSGSPLGDLDILLQWHELDPPDDFEMNRNNVVYTWQRNRNPFIDDPALVDHIFGDMQNIPYQEPLSVSSQMVDSVILYPNPSQGQFTIQGIETEAQVVVYNTLGQDVYTNNNIQNLETVQLHLPVGLYNVVITRLENTTVKKLLIRR